MTISTTASSVSYTGDGANKDFSWSFFVDDEDDLEVSLFDSDDESTVILSPSTYTVTLNADGTGSIHYPASGSAIDATQILTIQRQTPQTQGTDLEDQGGYYPSVVEAALDKLTMIVQELQRDLNNCLAFPLGSTTSAADLITQILNGAANASAAAASAAAAAASAATVLAALPVSTANIQALAVTAAKIAANAVTPIKLDTAVVNGGNILNGRLTASIAANAITIALKTMAGTDPSATDPCYILFRSASSGTGSLTVQTVTTALSFTISSGSTLGFSSGVASRFWVVVFDDGGTVRLGAINCLNGTAIYPLSGDGVASSTAEGGAGAADSPHVFYTGTAVATKAFTVLGFMTWDAGLVAAGAWAALPTWIMNFRPGVALPGQVIRRGQTTSVAVATGATVVPYDDTLPQQTEGTSFLSHAFTASSPANLLQTVANLNLASSIALGQMTAFILRTTDTDARAVVSHTLVNINDTMQAVLRLLEQANTGAAITYNIRAGLSAAGTTTLNGSAAARKFGGAFLSFAQTEEVQA